MGDLPRPRPRRGLVIGAGAAVGGAWAAGLLCALADVEGWEAEAFEVVVGTSAGSVLAALIGAGAQPGAIAEMLCGGVAEPLGVPLTDPVHVPDRVDRTISGMRRPVPLPGNLRLAARTLGRPGRHTVREAAAALAPRGRGSLAPVGELVDEVCGPHGWATRPRTWIVAMDFDSGRRAVFGAADQPVASLPEAVMASCSVPGLFPPRQIGSRRYVDGGVISVTNADLLAGEGLDEVLVLAPMTLAGVDPRKSAAARLDRRVRQHLTHRLRREVAQLRASGMTVRVLAPDEEDLAAMGTDLMDSRRRRTVFQTAVRTGTARLRSAALQPIDGVA